MATTTVEVVGEIAGDFECWCLEVAEDEWRRVKGDDEHRAELEARAAFPATDPAWRLYPADLIAAEGRVRLTIGVEPLGVECGPPSEDRD